MKKLIYAELMLTLFTASLLAGDVVVIVNKDNPATEITKTDIAKMFLGKMTRWPQGQKAKPCDQKAEAAVTAAFCKTYLGKSVSEYQAYWMEKMLSGAATPPKNAANDQEVIDFVSQNKGGIGFIESGTAAGDGVKAIAVE